MQRLDYIDQLKGFAILCVVFGHVMLFCLKCSHDSFVYHVVCSFHMPLFAFLSGLMFKPVAGWRTALGKFRTQSLKLLVPFATVGLVYTYWKLDRGGKTSSTTEPRWATGISSSCGNAI